MNEQTIWNYCKTKGLSNCGAAGLMGNLYAESGLQPNNLNNYKEKTLGLTDVVYTAQVDNKKYTNFAKDGAGYGLAQWTYWSRKQGLLELAQSKNKSIGDLNVQLDYLFYELENDFKNVLATLKSTNSINEASDIVLEQFEKPAKVTDTVRNQRRNYSKNYYNQFNTSSNDSNSGLKYSDSNPPLECMMTNSTCYKCSGDMTIKGVLWHSTGANNATLKRYVQPTDANENKDELLEKIGKNVNGNDWNHISVQAGVNAWIGKLADGSVTTVQALPWNKKPWGCGAGRYGSCNDGWIQFEICEDSKSNEDYFNLVYEEACQLTAYLCKKYNIDPNGTVQYNGQSIPTILCHADSNELGMGTNHADVYHWFGLYSKSMDDARADVSALLNKKVVVIEPVITNQTYDSVKIGHASKDENKKYSGGTAGDQTGSEVTIIDWYNAGWDYVLRPKEAAMAEKLATIIENSCNNNNIGYDQSQRNTLLCSAKAVSYKVENICAPCSCDCSSLVSVACIGAGCPEALFYPDGNCCITSNLRQACIDSGKFDVYNNSQYIRQKNYLKRGDILLNEQSHAAVCLWDGDKADEGVSSGTLVRVTAAELNVRKEASQDSDIVTTVKRNEVYTIVDVQNGYGKLKSGAGWISLSYVEAI